METIPIQSLTPETSPPTDASIRAVVTLSWPYSSSTRQCALLLADPDFRLRSKKGQVRVRFIGPSAEAVARSHLGIGDTVRLDLVGALWAQDAKLAQTPGRSVDGELVFNRKLELLACRSDGEVNISVNESTPPVSPEHRPKSPAATPMLQSRSHLRSSLNGATVGIPIYSSPAFSRRLRLSGQSLPGSSYDPFVDDELRLEPAKKKQRVSFDRVGQWRYAERTPSPVKDASPELEREPNADQIATQNDVEERVEQRQASEELPATSGKGTALDENSSSLEANSMLPPPLPRLLVSDEQLTPGVQETVSQENDKDQGPSTPKLQPVSSSGLPLPSPFPVISEAQRLSLLDASLASQMDNQPSRAEIDEDIADRAEGVDANEITTHEADAVPAVPKATGDDAARQAAQTTGPVQSQPYDRDAGEESHDVNGDDDGGTNENAFGEVERYGTVEHLPSDTEPDTDADGDLDGDEDQQPGLAEDHLEDVDMMDTGEDVHDRPDDIIYESDVEEVFEPSAGGSPPSDDEDDDGEDDDGDSEELGEEIAESPRAAAPAEQSPDSQEQHRADSPSQEDAFASQPQTPAKVQQREPELASAPIDTSPRTQPTPQSERDRIMAKTYQSLFGFSVAPESAKLLLETVTPTRASKRKLSDLMSGGDYLTGLPMGRTTEEQSTQPGEHVDEVMEVDSTVESQAIPAVEKQVAEIRSDPDNGTQIRISEEPSTTDLPIPEVEQTLEDALDAAVSDQEEVVDEVTNVSVPADPSVVVPDIVAEEENRASDGQPATPSPPVDDPAVDQAAKSPSPDRTLLTDDGQAQQHDLWTQLTENASIDPQLHHELLEAASTRSPEVEVVEAPPSFEVETEEEAYLQATTPPADSLHINQSRSSPVIDYGGDQMSLDHRDDVLTSDELRHEDSDGDMVPFESTATVDITEAPIETDEDLGEAAATPEATTKLIIEDDQSELHGGEVSTQPSLVAELDFSHSLLNRQLDDHTYPEITSPRELQIPENEDEEVGSMGIDEVQRDMLPSSQLEVIEIGSSSPVTEVAIPESPKTADLIDLEDLTAPDDPGSPELAPVLSETSETSQVNEVPALRETTLSPPVAFSQDQLMTDSVSYPTLPVTPIDSQRAPDVLDPSITQEPHSELTSSILPPTPQLTQHESGLQHMMESSQDQHSQFEMQYLLDGSRDQPDSTPVDTVTNDLPATQPQIEEVPADVEMTEAAAEVVQKKTPARKSLKSRLSNVPDVISAWFSPKRSSVASPKTSRGRPYEVETASPSRASKKAKLSTNGTDEALIESHTEPSHVLAKPSEPRANGILTPVSYFTPLASIEEKLNQSSQKAYGQNTVDVFAIITAATKDPQRAKSGPRDFFTTFQITDNSVATDDNANYRVDVFRPWKATLPVADVGDVILLRSFVVKSRNRRPYLLSTDASAWCVWRYSDIKTAEANEDESALPGRRSSLSGAGVGVREEIKGPPVELGEEERQHARTLHAHWMGSQRNAVVHSEDEADVLE